MGVTQVHVSRLISRSSPSCAVLTDQRWNLSGSRWPHEPRRPSTLTGKVSHRGEHVGLATASRAGSGSVENVSPGAGPSVSTMCGLAADPTLRWSGTEDDHRGSRTPTQCAAPCQRR